MSERAESGARPRAARWVRLVGSLLAVGACGFVAYRAWETRFWEHGDLAPGMLALLAVTGAAVYGISLHLNALAWCGLARPGGAPPRIVEMIAAYATAQVGKYLPGNVFHLAGRHALGRSLGLSHGALIAAAAGELALISLTALAVSALFAVGLSTRAPFWVSWTAGAVGFVGLAGAWLIRSRVGAWARRVAAQMRGRGRAIFTAVLLYAVFLGISGTLVWSVLRIAADGPMGSPAPVIGAVAFSWIAGFATPGAPSGVGVREAVLIEALRGTWGEESAVLAAVLFRVITLGGDALFFFAGLLLRRAARQSEPSTNN